MSEHARLWRTAGALLISYVILTFAGAVSTPMLGDGPSVVKDQLVDSDLNRMIAGGLISFLGMLLFVPASNLIGRLVRGASETPAWLASCATGFGVAFLSAGVLGQAAGGAAVYEAHHGMTLSTVTALNDIRDVAFILSGGVLAGFSVCVAAAVLVTRALPRWVGVFGLISAAVELGGLPFGPKGLIPGTMLGFVWLVALGIAAIRGASSAARQGNGVLAAA